MTKWSLKYFKIILFGIWLVYTKIWYTYTYYINGIDLVSQKWPKMTIDVWSDMKEKNEVVYKRCLKIVWYMCWYMAFFGMQTVYIYTEIYGANGILFGIRPEMTIFGWYTTGIWCPGIRIMTFFFAVLWAQRSWCLLFVFPLWTYSGFLSGCAGTQWINLKNCW